MKRYQALVKYGLLAYIGFANCDANKEALREPDPIYISGTVKSENYQKNKLEGDVYTLSLATDNGFETFQFTCPEAPALDALISIGDTVKMRLDLQRERTKYRISIAHITEINERSHTLSCEF